MSRRVWVAGASGVIGRPLVLALLARGHEVFAQSRSEEGAARARDAGATPIVCDALDRAAVREAVVARAPEVIVNQLTRLPARIDPRRVARDLADTNRLRTEGTRILVEAADAAGTARVVSQSVAFAYRPGLDRPAREDDPLHLDAPSAFQPLVDAVHECESRTLATGRGVVLRYGFFCGPGTIYAADGAFAEDVRRRRVPVVGDGKGLFPFVHVADAVSATVAAVEGDALGVLNVVDDEPAPVGAWLPAYAQALGAPRPLRVPSWVARLAAGPYGVHIMTRLPAVSNEAARDALGWAPAYPSWRDGLVAPLGGTSPPPARGGGRRPAPG